MKSNFCSDFGSAGVMAQEENATAAPSPQSGADARMTRGDMIPVTDAPGKTPFRERKNYYNVLSR